MKPEETFNNKRWMISGIVWGVMLYIFSVIVLPIILKETITWRSILISIPIWIVGGLLFGFSMNRYYSRKS